MNGRRVIARVWVGALMLTAGCTMPAAAPSVPSLSGGSAPGNAAPSGASSDRAAAVRAVADCIRSHGIPNYRDPILTPDGRVFSDRRSLEDAPRSVADAVQAACADLAVRAGFNPEDEPPAPPQLVQAGVKAAECLRDHGLPNIKDPTPQTGYTPDHGFGLDSSEMPTAGKADPTYQRAAAACRSLLDAEIAASTLENLGNG